VGCIYDRTGERLHGIAADLLFLPKLLGWPPMNGGNWQIIDEFQETESGKRKDRPELGARRSQRTSMSGDGRQRESIDPFRGVPVSRAGGRS
jgi:hypothetical protein